MSDGRNDSLSPRKPKSKGGYFSNLWGSVFGPSQADLIPAPSPSPVQATQASSPHNKEEELAAALNFYQNLKNSSGNLEMQIRDQMNDWLDPDVYRRMILDAPKDKNGLYIIDTVNKSNRLYYYQHALNFLKEFQLLMDPIGQLHAKVVPFIDKDKSTWEKAKVGFFTHGELTQIGGNLYEHYIDFMRTMRALGVDTLIGNLPGMNDFKKWIKKLKPLVESKEEFNKNTFVVAYKKNPNDFRKLVGLPIDNTVQKEEDDEDDEAALHHELYLEDAEDQEADHDYSEAILMDEASAKKEAAKLLKGMPNKVNDSYEALIKILKDLSGGQVNDAVQKDIEKTLKTINQILIEFNRFAGRTKNFTEVINFIYKIYPIIKKLIAALPQSYVSSNKVLQEHFLVMARQINLIIRTWFLYIDYQETEFYIKEGTLVKVGSGNKGCGLYWMANTPSDDLELCDKVMGEGKDAYVFTDTSLYYISRGERGGIRVKELSILPPRCDLFLIETEKALTPTQLPYLADYAAKAAAALRAKQGKSLTTDAHEGIAEQVPVIVKQITRVQETQGDKTLEKIVNKYSIYGCVNGVWELKPLSAQEAQVLEKLAFEKNGKLYSQTDQSMMRDVFKLVNSAHTVQRKKPVFSLNIDHQRSFSDFYTMDNLKRLLGFHEVIRPASNPCELIHEKIPAELLDYIRASTGHVRSARQYDDVDVSPDNFGKSFNAWIKALGYQFVVQERYPYPQALLAQAQEMQQAAQALEEKSQAHEMRKDYLTKRVLARQEALKASKEVEDGGNDYEEEKHKELLSRSLRAQISKRINELEKEISFLDKCWLLFTNTKCEKIRLLREILTQCTGESATISEKPEIKEKPLVKSVNAVLDEMKDKEACFALLREGRTGKLMDKLAYATSSPEDRILWIKQEISLLEQEKTRSLWFLSTWRKSGIDPQIKALGKLRSLLEQPGFRLQSALDILQAKDSVEYNILMSKEAKLLKDLRKIDEYTPNFRIKTKLLNFTLKDGSFFFSPNTNMAAAEPNPSPVLDEIKEIGLELKI